MQHVITAAPVTQDVLDGLFDALRAIGQTIMAIPAANEKRRQIEVLNSMTDSQLAARGLRREDIARHVFATGAL